jgi:hypothetical protein
MCERLAKKKISPYFGPEKYSLYGIACIIATSVFVEYMVSAFIILQFQGAIANWKSHYFFGHILSFGFYVALTLLPSPKKSDEKKSQ